MGKSTSAPVIRNIFVRFCRSVQNQTTAHQWRRHKCYRRGRIFGMDCAIKFRSVAGVGVMLLHTVLEATHRKHTPPYPPQNRNLEMTYGTQPSNLDLNMKVRTSADPSWTEKLWSNSPYVENMYQLISAECDKRATSHALHTIWMRRTCCVPVTRKHDPNAAHFQHIVKTKHSTFSAHSQHISSTQRMYAFERTSTF